MDDVIPIIYQYDEFDIETNTEKTSPSTNAILDLVTPSSTVVENPVIPSTITFGSNSTTSNAVAGNPIPVVHNAGMADNKGMHIHARRKRVR